MARGITLLGMPSGCPSICLVNTCFTLQDISIISGSISMKLATNGHHAKSVFRVKGQGHSEPKCSFPSLASCLNYANG